MTIADPSQIKDMAEQARGMTALRACFLIASHHGVALRPEDLRPLGAPTWPINWPGRLAAPGFRRGSCRAAPGRPPPNSAPPPGLPPGASLQPGMTLTAGVRTGSRTILDDRLDPLMRGLSESLREP